jgi:hypothetical protein
MPSSRLLKKSDSRADEEVGIESAAPSLVRHTSMAVTAESVLDDPTPEVQTEGYFPVAALLVGWRSAFT